MKILPFLITKSTNKSFHLQENKDKYFYEFLHQHPEIQLTLILEGEGEMIAGDYNGEFRPGDTFVIGSNMPHVFKSNQKFFNSDFNGECHSISVFFNWEVFGKHFWNMPELENICQAERKIQRGLKIGSTQFPSLKKFMLDLFNVDGVDGVFLLLHILNGIASMKEYNFLSKLVDFKRDSSDGDRLNNIYQFTMRNYHRMITLEEVADIANFTVNSFCRFFKKSTQKTYLEFLNEVRIGHACRLLVQGKSECVYNICFKVGFNDIANFNRHFKKFTGFTPTEYKLTKQMEIQELVATAS